MSKFDLFNSIEIDVIISSSLTSLLSGSHNTQDALWVTDGIYIRLVIDVRYDLRRNLYMMVHPDPTHQGRIIKVHEVFEYCDGMRTPIREVWAQVKYGDNRRSDPCRCINGERIQGSWVLGAEGQLPVATA